MITMIYTVLYFIGINFWISNSLLLPPIRPRINIPANFTNFLLNFYELFPGDWIPENERSHNNLAKKQVPRSNYDFIVVGAGTAGCVIASRLSENSNITVLLVEVGGPETIVTDAPASYPLLAKSIKDWAFVTESQNNAFLNMDGQRAQWERGKSIGGSYAVNGMVYLRGNSHDFDNWESLGNTGWSYNDVLPFFKLSERNTNTNFLANGYHGSNGPLTITSNDDSSPYPYSHITVDAWNELGFDTIDLNGEFSVGTNVAQVSILNGNRITTCKAFIEPIYDSRPNLDILAYSTVTKVLFSCNTAIGIQFQRFANTYTVTANKEVILSAGAIKSPQLLMLSGIGPKNQLNNFSIPVVHALPGVGENLHDHPLCIGLSFTAPQTDPPLLSIQSFIEYGASRTGPLAYFGTPICTAKSSLNNNTEWPDIQIYGVPFALNNDPTGVIPHNAYGLRFDVFAQMYLPYVNPHKSSFMLFTSASRPKSRGNLRLSSNNPFVNPILQPNYLSIADDRQILVDGLKWIYRISKTNSYSNYAQIIPSLVSGCESLYDEEYDDLFPNIKLPVYDYLSCQVSRMTVAGLHMVGTCKMGTVNDRLAVVDSQLRVYGVSGLRVIDASIMPVITDANTNAATIMIAERGSFFIKQQYNL